MTVIRGIMALKDKTVEFIGPSRSLILDEQHFMAVEGFVRKFITFEMIWKFLGDFL